MDVATHLPNPVYPRCHYPLFVTRRVELEGGASIWAHLVQALTRLPRAQPMAPVSDYRRVKPNRPLFHPTSTVACDRIAPVTGVGEASIGGLAGFKVRIHGLGHDEVVRSSMNPLSLYEIGAPEAVVTQGRDIGIPFRQLAVLKWKVFISAIVIHRPRSSKQRKQRIKNVIMPRAFL